MRKFLVTAGPTVEAIDPVRYISNHSTGKMGYAVASELASRGTQVVLVSGPVSLPVPEGVECINVVSAADMYEACVALWPLVDGAVMCAAVADYTPAKVSSVKIKKGDSTADGASDVEEEGFCLSMKPTRDIAAELGRTKCPGQLLVGFALETDHEEANALEKMWRKNLDIIVLNSLRDEGAGFGGDTNRITIYTRRPAAAKMEVGVVKTTVEKPGTEDIEGTTRDAALGYEKNNYPLESKLEGAEHIVDRMEEVMRSYSDSKMRFKTT